MNAKTLSALPKAEIHFIEPMYTRLVQELPEGQDWLYEVKFDGYRCLARRNPTGITLWSRRGNLFTEQFPADRPRLRTVAVGPRRTLAKSRFSDAGKGSGVFSS